MTKTIWFDMDGTIVDLYGVENWLDDITNERVDAYKNAKPLINMQVLARHLNRLIKQGYEIGVISWLAKGSTAHYDDKVIKAKRKWLSTHLKSVNFAYIDIVKYGTPKEKGRDGILFDDEIQNRNNWNGIAYNVNNILKILATL